MEPENSENAGRKFRSLGPAWMEVGMSLGRWWLWAWLLPEAVELGTAVTCLETPCFHPLGPLDHFWPQTPGELS